MILHLRTYADLWAQHGAAPAMVAACNDERQVQPMLGWEGALCLATRRADARELANVTRHARATGRSAT